MALVGRFWQQSDVAPVYGAKGFDSRQAVNDHQHLVPRVVVLVAGIYQDKVPVLDGLAAHLGLVHGRTRYLDSEHVALGARLDQAARDLQVALDILGRQTWWPCRAFAMPKTGTERKLSFVTPRV